MNSLRAEESRIRAAYERRAATDAHCPWFDHGHLFMVQQLERRIWASLRLHGLDPLQSRRILEVGCGTGHWLRQFIQWGASPENLTGVDLLEGRVTQAKRLCSSHVKIHRANAASLDFADASFDLVFQGTVFTSILDSELKAQLRRVTLAPPVVRRLAPYSWMGCYLLEKIPWLCTHYLGVIQKPRQ